MAASTNGGSGDQLRDPSAETNIQLNNDRWLKKCAKECIGRGGFGSVWKYTVPAYQQTPFKDNEVAVKKLNLLSDEKIEKNKKWNTFAKREVTIFADTDHPNVLKCFACYITPTAIKIILEYFPHTLKSFINERERLNLEDVRKIGFEVMKGLTYLHKEMKIIHRDIKSSNILISDSMVVTISDFGLSRYMTDSPLTCLGTESYMAPEVFRSREESSGQEEFVYELVTFSADIFSTGVVFYEMLTKKYPFTKKDLGQTQASLHLDGRCYFCQLLTTMLSFDPDKRLTAEEVLNIEFFQVSENDPKRDLLCSLQISSDAKIAKDVKYFEKQTELLLQHASSSRRTFLQTLLKVAKEFERIMKERPADEKYARKACFVAGHALRAASHYVGPHISPFLEATDLGLAVFSNFLIINAELALKKLVSYQELIEAWEADEEMNRTLKCHVLGLSKYPLLKNKTYKIVSCEGVPTLRTDFGGCSLWEIVTDVLPSLMVMEVPYLRVEELFLMVKKTVICKRWREKREVFDREGEEVVVQRRQSLDEDSFEILYMV